MADPFAPAETYDVTLTDPIDGETWTVTMRVLNAGDRAMLQDQLRVETDDQGNEAARVPMGTMRMLTVFRAIVKWSLPQPKTMATVAALREDLFDQLFDAARFDVATAEPVSVEEELAVADPSEPVAEKPAPAPDAPSGDA